VKCQSSHTQGVDAIPECPGHMQEINVMTGLAHPNVVQYVGVCVKLDDVNPQNTKFGYLFLASCYVKFLLAVRFLGPLAAMDKWKNMLLVSSIPAGFSHTVRPLFMQKQHCHGAVPGQSTEALASP
jgi:hypothetical protein